VRTAVGSLFRYSDRRRHLFLDLLAELQVELFKSGCLLRAIPQKSAGFELQRGNEIINSAVDVAAILPTMAFNVFGLNTQNADVEAIPSAMVALWPTATTTVSIRVFSFLSRIHFI